MPIQLLCGNDEYTIHSEFDKIRKKVLNKDFSSLNRKIIVENQQKKINIADILMAVDTTPMMFGNLLIEVHSTSLFMRGKSFDEKLMNQLITSLTNLSENVFVVFICIFPKDEDRKIDSVKKIVKTIKEIGTIQEFNRFKFYETQKFTDWIIKTAKAKKITISQDNADFLFSCVGADLRTLDSELEKLKTYILPDNTITKDDIINVSQENEDAFTVLDLWLNNSKVKLIEELNKLVIKDEPQTIIALFQTITQRWLRIKLEAQYSTPEEIGKIINKHPYYVKNELIRLKNKSADELLILRKNLNKAEFQMKTGQIQPQTALEMALVN